MDVRHDDEQINVPAILMALLDDFSTVIDYRTLRDKLPRRLASLFKCRCLLLYLLIDDTLQLAAGSFDDIPGWSAALLAVAHVNPISIYSDEPEAYAWRERQLVKQPAEAPRLIAVPLIYRQRCIGVMVALRGQDGGHHGYPTCWSAEVEDVLVAVAGVVALLLENTRLLEHDRERIHELALLNSMSSQMNYATYDIEHLRRVIMQRVREIAMVDLCYFFEPALLTSATDQDHHEIPSWLTPRLSELLLRRFQEHRLLKPVIIERPGDSKDADANLYFEELPGCIKTFFAFPLMNNRVTGRSGRKGLPEGVCEIEHGPPLLGCIIGGYYHPCKMRQSEIALLQVLASQAGAILENMRLMREVIVARNEARRLLHHVLDDQRLNALILESIPSGLIATDVNGRIHTFNRAASVILGYHPYEVLGQPLQKILDLHAILKHETVEPVTNVTPLSQQGAFLAGMHAGEAKSETIITTDRYDRRLVLDVDARPLYDNSGVHVGLLASFIDVTAMHRLEEERRRLDRLASLGEMSASVAHEVRNPLASIKTSIQMLRDDLLDNDVHAELSSSSWVQESIAVMLKEVERLDTIVRDLLLFAKPHQLHRVRCDIVGLCEHVLSLILPQRIEANVEIHRVFDTLPPIWIDAGQIEQVLLNLYLNALQAMPDGGVLTISCHRMPTAQAIYDTAGSDCPPTQRPSGNVEAATSAYAWLIDQHVLHKEFAVAYWLEIVVRDTGVGMSTEQLQHIFQPFYTTKAHGIGLGLAITRRLVEDHGGYLRIDSQFGYGTTVAIRIPFVENSIERQKADELPANNV